MTRCDFNKVDIPHNGEECLVPHQTFMMKIFCEKRFAVINYFGKKLPP